MFRTLSSTWNDPFHPRRNIPKTFGATVFGTHLQEIERAKSFPVNRYRKGSEGKHDLPNSVKGSQLSLQSPDQRTAITQLHSQLQAEKAVSPRQKRAQIEAKIAEVKQRLQS